MNETVKEKPAAALPWSPAAMQGAHPETPTAELDAAVKDLQASKESWTRLQVPDRIRLLERLLRDYEAVAPEAVAAACKAKGLDPGDPRSGEEWLGGPLLIQRNLRLLAQSLGDVLAY
ncbi:hypothetical protein HY251_10355 [bacterium]|nr:hypothetical protein [bacterium]